MHNHLNSLLQYKEIVVALIAVFGVVIPYLVQRNKEYKLKLAEQKIAAYSEFLRDFTETAVLIAHDEEVAGKDADRRRIMARNQILLYGSDDVIKAYDKWVVFTDENQKAGSDEDVALFGDLLLKIRQDIVGTTKVTVHEISNLNPFNRGSTTNDLTMAAPDANSCLYPSVIVGFALLASRVSFVVRRQHISYVDIQNE